MGCQCDEVDFFVLRRVDNLGGRIANHHSALHFDLSLDQSLRRAA
jgi:hypothetical protein